MHFYGTTLSLEEGNRSCYYVRSLKVRESQNCHGQVSFLPTFSIWKSFLITLQAERSTTSKKDELIEQLAPIFHNPNIVLPMRILTVQEVRKLAGLENILTAERHGRSLLTDKVIRDFCGNSFHPSLISAALGTDDQLLQWVEGNNDAQPCCRDLPCIQEVYTKYQDLLKLVLEQAAARGVQLKADRVDFEAKWRHYSLNDTAVAIHPPSSAPADSICVSAGV